MSEPRSGQLRALVERIDAASLSPLAIARARMGILDAVGCIVGGSRTPAARAALALAREEGGDGDVPVLGTAVRLPAGLAALANGVAGHVLDYDDMSAAFVGHPSVVLVPAILALAGATRASGRAMIGAYVLGFEVDAWLGRLMVPRHYDAGWHSTSSLGVFGAAAAAARLLGLDAKATVNALAIAASSAAGLRANFGSMTKSLHAGLAAEAGVRAARLSARGFTANAAVFDGPGGFFEAYGMNEPARPASAGLEIEGSGIGIKPYACCGAGVSVIDAVLQVRAIAGFHADSVEAVGCTVSAMARRIMPFAAASDGLQAKYCLAYCAAVALLDGKGGLAQFDDERVARADVQSLLRKVRVRDDRSMVSGAGRFGVDLHVRLHDGSVRSATLEVPLGHPLHPLDDEALAAKFLECAGPVVGEARAREAAARLASLDTQPDLARVIEPLSVAA